jgi:hypothetical protein
MDLLNKTGLQYFWGKLKAYFVAKDTLEEYPKRGSSMPVTADGILNYCVVGNKVAHTSEVTNQYFKRSGGGSSANGYAYRIFNVTPGETYAICSSLGSGYTSGYIRVVFWLDANDEIIYYSDEGNDMNEARRYYDYLYVAPAGAAKAVVNYRVTYSMGGTMKRMAPPHPSCVLSTAQTLTAAEQLQARSNIGSPTIVHLTDESEMPATPDANTIYMIDA